MFIYPCGVYDFTEIGAWVHGCMLCEAAGLPAQRPRGDSEGLAAASVTGACAVYLHALALLQNTMQHVHQVENLAAAPASGAPATGHEDVHAVFGKLRQVLCVEMVAAEG